MSKKIKCLLLTSLLVMSLIKTEQVSFTSTKEALSAGFEIGLFTGIIPIAFPFIFSASVLAMDIDKCLSSSLDKTLFVGSAISGAMAGVGAWSMVGQYITGTNEGRYVAAIPVALALLTMGACYERGYFMYVDRFLKINVEEYKTLQEIVFKEQGKAFKTAFLNAYPIPTEEAVKKLAQCVDHKVTIQDPFQPFTVKIGKKTVTVRGRIGLIFARQMDELP